MIWQYILTSLSAIMLFGFVAECVAQFGLLSCFSAYGPKWRDRWYLPGTFNVWSAVVILSAFLLAPVLLEQSNDSPWQFLGFLAPTSLVLVGITPNYQTNKLAYWVHQFGAWPAIIFIILYTVLIPLPYMVFVIVGLLLVSVILGILFKGTWMFWGEMAVYLATYVIMFLVI